MRHIGVLVLGVIVITPTFARAQTAANPWPQAKMLEDPYGEDRKQWGTTPLHPSPNPIAAFHEFPPAWSLQQRSNCQDVVDQRGRVTGLLCRMANGKVELVE